MALPRNKSWQAVKDNRKMMIASLRLRGLTQSEISIEMEKQGCVNPKTGKAWSLAQICNDLKELKKEWMQEAQADIAEHRARQLKEYQEIKKKGWEGQDLALLLRVLKQESVLLGSEAPANFEITMKKEIEGIVDYLEKQLDAESYQKLIEVLAKYEA